MNYYDGKTVYITGGSSGIGLATAVLLASYGANVAIFARNKERLEKALAEIEGSKKSGSQRFAAESLDVSDNRGVKKAMAKAVKKFGAPDVLINSAGVAYCNDFENTSFEKFDEEIKIDLYGVWNVCEALVPVMKAKGAGHIVNISSLAGLVGVYGYTAYSAAKFGLIGFSESLRGELKPHNVNVSVLCPPDTDTPQLREENKTKPAETKAISGNAGLYQPDFVAKAMLKDTLKKKFVIIPGFEGKFTHIMKRLFPWLVEAVMDGAVKKVRRQAAKK
ncbi:MAG TPA: SDR family oxidoreductase [Spirochaetota bacterium]|nr:SDR family oxidoreductase [Spirochaetota bacterium]